MNLPDALEEIGRLAKVCEKLANDLADSTKCVELRTKEIDCLCDINAKLLRQVAERDALIKEKDAIN